MAQKDVKLKLVIDRKENRVLFAEADKKVVDFLFHLLSLPLGTVCKLLKTQTMILGSLENLYESVQTLNQIYLQPNHNIETLLKPKVISFCTSTHPPSSSLETYYKCCCEEPVCDYYFCDDPTTICPQCKKYEMSLEILRYVKPPTEEEAGNLGYVKDVVSYMVMDDLSVKPMSNISCITLLNNFNIKDVDALEEKVITFDVNQGVELLRASLQGKTVLTDVFLGKKKRRAVI